MLTVYLELPLIILLSSGEKRSQKQSNCYCINCSHFLHLGRQPCSTIPLYIPCQLPQPFLSSSSPTTLCRFMSHPLPRETRNYQTNSFSFSLPTAMLNELLPIGERRLQSSLQFSRMLFYQHTPPFLLHKHVLLPLQHPLFPHSYACPHSSTC